MATNSTDCHGLQVATKAYPAEPVGDPLEVSKAMRAKYAPIFTACS